MHLPEGNIELLSVPDLKLARGSRVAVVGPNGSGKTTLAHIIAHQTKAKFQQLNAGTTGVPELRKYISQAQEAARFQAHSTILFLDEIHRFNKAQQDFLLSFVEDGTIRLIGATTENPSFEINDALLSRMQVYPFQPLEPHHIQQLIQRALNDTNLSQMQVDLTEEGEQLLVLLADGDIRLALNALELAAQTCQPDDQQRRQIQSDQIQEAVQKRDEIIRKSFKHMVEKSKNLSF